MKRNKVFNLIMIAAIVAILGGGILLIGNLKGWFDKDTSQNPSPSSITVKELAGIVNIERNNVGYYLSDDSKLRQGDIIQTLSGSKVKLYFNENSYISLNEDSEIEVTEISDNKLIIKINKGEIFACSNVGEGFILSVICDDLAVNVKNAVFSAVNITGSQNIRVFEYSADVIVGQNNHTIDTGKIISSISHEDSEDEIQINDMHQSALNEFLLNSVISAAKTENLCFSEVQAKKILEDRESEKAEAMRVARASDSRILERGGNVQVDDNGNENPNDGKEKKYCTISIRCDTILNNMKDLDKGKGKYVPSNGIILSSSQIEFYEGETVFDVLKRACNLANIQIEYSWTPIYGSYYVEGLNHLYEFDCGGQSGWMYKVNGWYPNYGCSEYKIKEGDIISWNYTCKGLGGDLGAPMQ